MLEYINKNIDQKTIQMIQQILNSPDGQKLKAELSKMNKDELLNMLSKKDLSHVDFNQLKNTLSTCDKNKLIETMRHFNKKG